MDFIKYVQDWNKTKDQTNVIQLAVAASQKIWTAREKLATLQIFPTGDYCTSPLLSINIMYVNLLKG